jgi:menaquinone-dependent protoporphyrinogen oxidase
MNVLVVYGSHLGSTAVIAEHVAAVIRHDAGAEVLVQPAEFVCPVDRYDAVIVGGGIYAGRWHPESVAFVQRHATSLATRAVWFFSSGPVGDAAAAATPVPPVGIDSLIKLVNARGHAVFGGSHDRSEVDDSDLDRLGKFVARRFVPEGDWRNWDAIAGWARQVAIEIAAPTHQQAEGVLVNG